MTTIITIHRGELLQIKRMITDDGQKRGNLHGLFTESYQPVILIAFGGNKEQIGGCEIELKERHSLIKLGEWCIEQTDADTCLVFDNEGELCSIFYDGVDAKAEIIEEQSAFRLFESVRDMLPKTSNDHANEPIPLPPPTTHSYQWYITDRGQTVMAEIYKDLPEKGFTIYGISRDSSSHDMCLNIQFHSGFVQIYFPMDFPTNKPTAVLENIHSKDLEMKDVDDSSQPEQVVRSLVDSLLQFLSEKANDDNKSTNESLHHLGKAPIIDNDEQEKQVEQKQQQEQDDEQKQREEQEKHKQEQKDKQNQTLEQKELKEQMKPLNREELTNAEGQANTGSFESDSVPGHDQDRAHNPKLSNQGPEQAKEVTDTRNANGESHAVVSKRVHAEESQELDFTNTNEDKDMQQDNNRFTDKETMNMEIDNVSDIVLNEPMETSF